MKQLRNSFILLVFLSFEVEAQNVETIKIRKEQKDTVKEPDQIKIVSLINSGVRWPSPHWQGNGTVYVRFTVDSLGYVQDPIILKGLDSLADAEVLRVVNNLPRFKPMFSEGKRVKVFYTIPVRFKLN